jgi:hypothetical protein
MDIPRLLALACLPLALLAEAANAAAPASAPASSPAGSATAPRSSKPVKRPLNSEELRESATFPGDMRPEDMPPPQVTVPLGRKPPPPSPAEASEAAQGAAMPGKIDDRVARCKAMADPRQRVACTRAVAASDAAHR